MAGKVYDVVVVGSGASGGWAAKELCEAGLEVVMLEAGRELVPEDFTEHQQPFDLKYRGRGLTPEIKKRQPIQTKCYGCGEANHQLFVDDLDNPYTYPKKKPFWWIRGRQVGGRTFTWGRQSYRHSPKDFKAASHDGYGDDWPISYDDLAPYYDKAERFSPEMVPPEQRFGDDPNL